MDKKLKLLLYFLNFLSKKVKSEQLTFEQYKKIAIDSGFKMFMDNTLIYNFYNKVTFDGVKWENYIDELKPLLNTFIDKIILIKDNSISPRKVFSDPIDEYFGLGYENNDRNYIDFSDNHIVFHFKSRSNRIFLNLLNLSEEDIHVYESARYNGNCYRPDNFRDDMEYAFKGLESKNIELLKSIIFLLGNSELSKSITSDRLIDTQIQEIFDLFMKIKGGEDLLDDIYREYQNEVERASCESIEEAFTKHFEGTGIEYVDDNEFNINYDVFIDFLKENPKVQTFYDLRNHQFIGDSSYVSEAYYEFDNVDFYSLNSEIYRLLDDFKDDIEEDEEVQERIKSMKELENILDELNFNFEKKANAYYNKTFKDVVYVIPLAKIDYENKKVTLASIDQTGEFSVDNLKYYKIPFDEISDYVHTRKLYESLLKKIKRYL